MAREKGVTPVSDGEGRREMSRRCVTISKERWRKECEFAALDTEAEDRTNGPLPAADGENERVGGFMLGIDKSFTEFRSGCCNPLNGGRAGTREAKVE